MTEDPPRRIPPWLKRYTEADTFIVIIATSLGAAVVVAIVLMMA